MLNSQRCLRPIVFALLVVLVGAAAQVQPNQGEAAPPTTITIHGSDSFLHLVTKWLTVFSEESETFDFDLTTSSSSEGIENLIDGRTDIALSSRRVKPQELAIARQKGLKLREILVAHTGISVIVNRANSASSLTLEQVGNVFAGTVRNWQALDGPDESIVVVQKTSGSSPRLFREKVLGEREFVTEAIVVDSKEAVVVEVGNRPWSIGFTGLGEALLGHRSVKIVLLQRDSSGESSTYALKRPFYFYTIEGNLVVQQFIDFVVGEEGQALITGSAYFPGS